MLTNPWAGLKRWLSLDQTALPLIQQAEAILAASRQVFVLEKQRKLTALFADLDPTQLYLVLVGEPLFLTGLGIYPGAELTQMATPEWIAERGAVNDDQPLRWALVPVPADTRYAHCRLFTEDAALA